MEKQKPEIWNAGRAVRRCARSGTFSIYSEAVSLSFNKLSVDETPYVGRTLLFPFFFNVQNTLILHTWISDWFPTLRQRSTIRPYAVLLLMIDDNLVFPLLRLNKGYLPLISKQN